MAAFRWVLLLIGLAIIALVFAYSRGLFSGLFRPRRRGTPVEPVLGEPDDTVPEPEPEPEPEVPVLSEVSRVVTVRIMPPLGADFPAEALVLALREAGLRHGQFGIFHAMADGNPPRIRFSVASLVEPGAFDLTNLKDSTYKGISMFMVLPAPEDGVQLFDEMLETARDIAKRTDGRLVDEQGGAMSVQRERYMREEVIDFLRRLPRTELPAS